VAAAQPSLAEVIAMLTTEALAGKGGIGCGVALAVGMAVGVAVGVAVPVALGPELR
jgi:hypothetical protein